MDFSPQQVGRPDVPPCSRTLLKLMDIEPSNYIIGGDCDKAMKVGKHVISEAAMPSQRNGPGCIGGQKQRRKTGLEHLLCQR